MEEKQNESRKELGADTHYELLLKDTDIEIAEIPDSGMEIC